MVHLVWRKFHLDPRHSMKLTPQSINHGEILSPAPCYDHVQLWDLSGYSGRSVTYSGHSRAVILPLSTTPGLCSIHSLPHLAIYPALT